MVGEFGSRLLRYSRNRELNVCRSRSVWPATAAHRLVDRAL